MFMPPPPPRENAGDVIKNEELLTEEMLCLLYTSSTNNGSKEKWGLWTAIPWILSIRLCRFHSACPGKRCRARKAPGFPAYGKKKAYRLVDFRQTLFYSVKCISAQKPAIRVQFFGRAAVVAAMYKTAALCKTQLLVNPRRVKSKKFVLC